MGKELMCHLYGRNLEKIKENSKGRICEFHNLENGKYIVYKKGDNNPFTGISIPTKNPNMKVFYESGIVIKKEQVTDNGYKRVTTYDSDGITKQNNTTYYDANGNVCTQKDFLKNLYN